MDRYNLLKEEDMTKVQNAFARCFAPIFTGHIECLTQMKLKDVNPIQLQLIIDAIKDVENSVLDDLVTDNFKKTIPKIMITSPERGGSTKITLPSYNGLSNQQFAHEPSQYIHILK